MNKWTAYKEEELPSRPKEYDEIKAESFWCQALVLEWIKGLVAVSPLAFMKVTGLLNIQ